MHITNFEEAQNELRKFYDRHGKYTLEPITRLMDFLGNPQETFKTVHVAGTSGKTSTSYFAAGLLNAAGYKVGLTVSPHVDYVNERVQIGLVPLPEAEFCKELGEFLDIIDGCGIKLSYFEVMVGFAYWYFAKAKVDYAVVEVGLGGRIDGTNVINRADKICIITSIGLDHTKILGSTLPEIAAEKAGIIQPGNEVFAFRQSLEIMDVFQAKSEAQHAKLHIIMSETQAITADLPLFQQHNLALATAAVSYAMERDGKRMTDEIVASAAQTYIPARMEIVEYKGRTVIIDGSHNSQKLQTLFASMREKFPGENIAALAGFVDGDESRIHDGLAELTKHVNSIIFTEFASEKDLPKVSLPAEELVHMASELKFSRVKIVKTPVKALDELMRQPEDILLITGSFYLLNHIRPHIIGT